MSGSDTLLFLRWYHVKGINQVAFVVRAPQRVVNVDEELALPDIGEISLDRDDIDPWFPLIKSDSDLLLESPDGVGVDSLEHHIVNAASEVRAHGSLPGCRTQND